MIRSKDFMPIMIGSGDSTKLLLVSPSKKSPFNNRKYSANIEVFGTPSSGRALSSGYGRARSNEFSFPRKTNLPDRKKEVLRIAAENFKIVQRL